MKKKKKLVQQGSLFEGFPEKDEKKVGGEYTRKHRVDRKASSLGSLLDKYQKPDKNKYISQEFQAYGLKLATEFGEESKKSMYIRLAKTTDRVILERARSYVIDAPNAKTKGKLFMWAVGKLRKGEKLGSFEEEKEE